MIRAQKIEKAERLKSALEDSKMVVVVRHRGLDSTETTDLRRKGHASDVKYHVVRNRMMPFVLGDGGLQCLLPLFSDSSAIFVSNDDTSAAKLAHQCAKETGKMDIVGGALNDHFLDADKVGKIAQLPSLDVVRAGLIGLITRPAAKLAFIAAAPASSLIGVTAAQGRSGGAE